MRFRNTLILGIIFVALGAYVVFVEFERAAEEAKPETLFDLVQEEVDAVTLTYPEREISLARVDGKWRITAPLDTPADESAANNLVRAIAECKVTKRLDDVPEDLEPFGLAEPGITIRVEANGEALPEIRVGKDTPVGYSTYIQRADDPKVLLTESAFQSGMRKEVNDLRDKTIVQFSDDAVQKIALIGPNRDILLVRSDGNWVIEQPRKYDADDSKVQSFLSTLLAMRATGFSDEPPVDLEPYGLDIPRLSVTLFFGENEDRKEILVGNHAGNNQIYVKTAALPTIYKANDWVRRDLDKNLNDFRDKTILAFDKDTVTAVHMQRGEDDAFELQKVNENMWILLGLKEDVDDAKVDQFVHNLGILEGYEIAADNPDDLELYGLASPELTITLREISDSIGTIKLGKYVDEEGQDSYSAMRDGSNTVFRLRDYVYERTEKTKRDFLVPRPIAATPPVALEVVED